MFPCNSMLDSLDNKTSQDEQREPLAAARATRGEATGGIAGQYTSGLRHARPQLDTLPSPISRLCGQPPAAGRLYREECVGNLAGACRHGTGTPFSTSDGDSASRPTSNITAKTMTPGSRCTSTRSRTESASTFRKSPSAGARKRP